jgi:hypothetical protein
MKKDTKPPQGVSKSNVTASATAGTQQRSSSRQPRLDAAAASAPSSDVVPMTAPPPPMSARYIDSRLKQFCLR